MIKERNNLGATASMCISLTHGRALGAGVIRDAGPVQRVEWSGHRDGGSVTTSHESGSCTLAGGIAGKPWANTIKDLGL